MLKKLVCIILTLIIALGCFTAVSANETTARLYTVYGDNMLFEQSKEAIFAGEGTPGKVIRAQLLNENSWPVRTASGRVADDGTFEISFIAPAGSYNEYTIELTHDGDKFATLNNVVFGELWLASGQSNMQFPLAQSIKGAQMYEQNLKLSKWLRVCMEPAYPTYNGTNAIPANPQNDIIDVKWINGENNDVYNMSAVAYFFAEEIMAELDMPVGIINSSLGGTSIATWLSREAIESDQLLKQAYINGGLYIDKNSWDENGIDIYNDMTANYNLRTHAYRNFRPSGMIWYQGETDLIYAMPHDTYAKSFDALQQMYTDMFDYKNGFFPIVYTQIASYNYGDYTLNEWNRNYVEIQNTLPDYRAMITLYDLPLTYMESAGVIHPQTKEPVGKRMAWAAKDMVYGKNELHTAASIKSAQINDGSIYVTLKNTGDGLKADGNTLECFAICGNDGIYVQARAEIISADTVRIWSDEVSEPASATYAYGVSNLYANLYSTQNGELTMPVCAFETKKISNAHYWSDKKWTDAEHEEIWHNLPDPYSAYYSAWKSDNAQTAIDKNSAYSGENGLTVTSENSNFTVKPVQLYKNDTNKVKPFYDYETDFSDYGTISFYVRNNGESDVKLEMMKIYTESFIWYSPAVEGIKDVNVIIPADNKWHKITFDLDSLYLFGNKCGFTYANEKLDYTYKFEFDFFCADKNADISIDEFRFTPSAENSGTRFEADITSADGILEFISAIFTTFIGFFAQLFA